MNKKQRKLEIRLERHKVHEKTRKLTTEQLEWGIEIPEEIESYHGLDAWDEDKNKKSK